MVSLRPFHVLMVTLFLVSLSHVVLCDPIMQPLIDRICRSMEDYGFCNKVFNDNLDGHPKNMVGLGEIAQLQALNKANDNHIFVMKLYNNAPAGPKKDALRECVNAYSVVSTQFQNGLLEFEQGRYQDALDTERITPRAQSSCSSTISDLTERNRETRILIAMAITTCLDIIQKK